MADWLVSPKMWPDTFVLGAPLLEKVLRPILVYVFLVVALRVFGKRELAQLNPFDLVVLLSLSNTVQNAIIGNDNSLTGGLIGALALLVMNYLVVRFLFRHRRLDQMFEGKPTVLVEHGHLDRKALARELLTKIGTDDRAASAGLRRPGGGGALRARTGRHVLHSAQVAVHRQAGARRGDARPDATSATRLDTLLAARGARRDDYN